jgi:hypothetical protein
LASARLTLGLSVASVKILDIPRARYLESQRTALAGQVRTYIRDGSTLTVHTYSDIAPTYIGISLHPSSLYQNNCCSAFPWSCTNMALARSADNVW